MRYFVISDDGSRYGPADLATLKQWAQEGRLLGTQYLEEETGGRRILAAELTGLTFAPPAGGGYAPGAAAAAYPRQGFADASKDMNQGWIFGVLSIFCCPIIFAYFGLQAAKRAEEKGANATGPKVLCYLGIGLWILNVIFRLATLRG
ncbi:hypothetical protein EON81_14675 [bacterium]|nr:MAG: hypothetical protein EON81_14675 [bacterium]